MRRATLIPDALSSSAEPLCAAEFAAFMEAFGPFAPTRRLAIAVSGGPDSMALAYCTSRWAQEKKLEMLAFIVDHGLRDDSTVEAAETQKRLFTLGLNSEILRWQHPPILSRLHATARKARYHLLMEACQRHNLHDLLFAHQREDQAETILMRFAKGSGIDGLAGMPQTSQIGHVRILRPLLTVTKERLVATCVAAHIPFVKDPSNVSEKFARGRLRRVLPLLREEGFTIDRLIDLGLRAEETRAALEHYVYAFLRVATTRDDAGVIRINLEHLRSAPPAIAQRALTLCLQGVSPGDYAPERTSLSALREGLSKDDVMESRTLYGCLISKNQREAIIVREYSAITDAPTLTSGATILWDGRWTVTLENNAPSHSYTVRPLGNLPHEILDRFSPGLRHKAPQGRARSCLPSLWAGEELALIPSFSNQSNNSSLSHAHLLEPWPPQKNYS